MTTVRKKKTVGTNNKKARGKKSSKLAVKLFDQKGTEKGEFDLNPTIFGAKINRDLMVRAIRVRLARARLGTRKTKARSEVSGGGRKPWRQKGTGRARHGSIRSPLWPGGGHSHALSPYRQKLRLPVKMKRRALFSALSSKVEAGQVVALDEITLKEAKTKKLQRVLQDLPVKGKALVVLPEKSKTIELSARNLPDVKTLEARLLNTYDVLGSKNILILSKSFKVIEQTFLPEQKVK